jgi:asparagine synthase (glutamine-hydrolysing)
MAHSLEVREPLMDHVLVEWMARLPSALKTSPSEGKLLLKRAHEARLPNEVLYRPKMGFSVPLARWLRGPLAQRLEKAVMGGALADSDLFEMGAVRQLLAQHQSGRRDRSSVLWSLLMFEAFLRRTHGGDGALPKSTASSAVLAA